MSIAMMWTRLCLCTLLIAALFQLDTSYAALLDGKTQEVRWDAFSEGRMNVNRWARRSASSFRAETDHVRQLVGRLDYVGDYSPVHNSNDFTASPPPSPATVPKGKGRRRLLQDYAPSANKSKSPKGRKLLQDYNAAANPSIS